MAASDCEWAHSLLRGAHEQLGDRHVSVPGGLALAPRARAAQSHRVRLLGADAPAHRAVAAPCARMSSLSPEATWRRHLRQEPDAVMPLVRIRGGGYEQSSSLLRPQWFPWPGTHSGKDKADGLLLRSREVSTLLRVRTD